MALGAPSHFSAAWVGFLGNCFVFHLHFFILALWHFIRGKFSLMLSFIHPQALRGGCSCPVLTHSRDIAGRDDATKLSPSQVTCRDLLDSLPHVLVSTWDEGADADLP